MLGRKRSMLQHHRYTGRRLHHSYTSYRSLAVLLLAVGIILSWFLHQAVNAASYTVTAKNPAPIPSTPATIDEPTNGTLTKLAKISISGSCPVIFPAISVVITDNGNPVGSTPCDASGIYSLQITLPTAGANSLLARTINFTSDYGPDGTPVNITYSPSLPKPKPNPNPNPDSGSGNTPVPPPSIRQLEKIAINSDAPFVLFSPTKDAQWNGSFVGGVPPYIVTARWGDGTINTYKNIGLEHQSFSHTYSVMKNYTIHIDVKDSASNTATASYAAITPYIPPAIGYAAGPGPGLLWLVGIYGCYLISLSILGSAWAYSHGLAYAKVAVRHGRFLVIAKRRRRRDHE